MMGGLDGPPSHHRAGTDPSPRAPRPPDARPRPGEPGTRLVTVDVVPTAEAVDPDALVGRTALVIDVLRASTSMIAALAHGAEAIVPVAEPDEARERAASLRAGTALVAGERRGEMVPGFDLGNSPVAFASDRVRGRTIVFTTSNGTRALLAARRAAAIGVAAFVNVSAATAWAEAARRDVTIICSGDRGRVSLEDMICAGLLVERLVAGAGMAATTAAADAAKTAAPYAADIGRLAVESSWARRLAAAGHGGDLAACLQLDTTLLVPIYLADVDKVVLGPR